MQTLLIANRGEIARRIAATASRLGMRTVAVYADPDRDAAHVADCDLAVALGGATPAESYLDLAKLLDAAHRSGADAVHPGYGFLAENAEFARAVIAAGLTWIGPTPEQIDLMGDKLAAKREAERAGVPTLPSVEVAAGEPVPVVGVPALVKAAAGGGGRGMRVVRDAAALGEAIAAASREAASAFGDGRVFVERYVERGRHVEVQVLGDRFGRVVHLGERECSIQRRNQKVIEETPSPGITAEVRQRLGDAAVALAARVGYVGAGTVEFLVEGDDAYFLEMNTRLQVEHPVTEAVTGLDLVELQLRVAAGEPLPFTQADVHVVGHAIEARLVAEDPARDWLPSVGRLHRFDTPSGVRVDAAFGPEGGTVSPYYDSLVAKVIAHGATRADAARELARALTATRLPGVPTNRDALVAILREPDFLAGVTHTTYLADHPEVVAGSPVDDDVRLAHLAAVVLDAQAEARAADRLWGFAPTGWRNLPTQGQRDRWHDAGRDVVVDVEYVVCGPSCRLTTDAPHDVVLVSRDHDGVRVEVDGVQRTVRLYRHDDAVWANTAEGQTEWRRLPRFVDHDAELAGGGPVAPVPGTVVAVHVGAGEQVEVGQLLVVLEAMKMEHRIEAHGPAMVRDVPVGVGDQVDAGQVLVHLDELEA